MNKKCYSVEHASAGGEVILSTAPGTFGNEEVRNKLNKLILLLEELDSDIDSISGEYEIVEDTW